MNPFIQTSKRDFTFHISPILRSGCTATTEDGHLSLIDHLSFIKCCLVNGQLMLIGQWSMVNASARGQG